MFLYMASFQMESTHTQLLSGLHTGFSPSIFFSSLSLSLKHSPLLHFAFSLSLPITSCLSLSSFFLSIKLFLGHLDLYPTVLQMYIAKIKKFSCMPIMISNEGKGKLFQNEKYKIGELMNNFCPLELTPREWCW